MRKTFLILVMLLLSVAAWSVPAQAEVKTQALCGYDVIYSNHFTTPYGLTVTTGSFVQASVTYFTPGSPGVWIYLYDVQNGNFLSASFLATSANPGPFGWSVPCGMYTVRLESGSSTTPASGIVKVVTDRS